MKRKLLLLVCLVSVVTTYFAVKDNNSSMSLLEANIAALSQNETGSGQPELSDKVWFRYEYVNPGGYPGVNCLQGGSDDCLIH